MGRKIFFLLCLSLISLSLASFGEAIKERFEKDKRLVYKVYFNGIPSGTIEWEYLGRDNINGRVVDALSLSSDTKILHFLNLESKEKVFLDSQSYLPIKVERDVIFFGKKELITEVYDQDKGSVKIIKSNSKEKEEVLYPDKPIHNILSLLYFFPKDIELKKDKIMAFNLPTQKLEIRMVSLKELPLNGKKYETYFLIGKGARRFNLWLDKEERIPLRLEFISWIGKISIVKKNHS